MKSGTLWPVKTMKWRSGDNPVVQLRELRDLAREIGVVVIEFEGASVGSPPTWKDLQPWTRTRAVTVADMTGVLSGPGLDVALCCDLVYLREGATLVFPQTGDKPTAGQTWAWARAGRAALAKGLLEGGGMEGADAVRMGVAHELVPLGARLPLPETLSLAALTAARDLMRCTTTGGPGRILELATFRLLFAAGDPGEGARAFLEKRSPRFPSG